ncbi:hypothetical protein JTE90_008425 [Oedothorax gibbosus]|uniref:Uncharacterized protein n=1 Tax=Oedothorax gibbosus TaxID=931172 RepID=A0AAV6UV69_9ARAC|nr:hypothetical protein JTE90_008425 [Oedothorax gibbosus]
MIITPPFGRVVCWPTELGARGGQLAHTSQQERKNLTASARGIKPVEPIFFSHQGMSMNGAGDLWKRVSCDAIRGWFVFWG